MNLNDTAYFLFNASMSQGQRYVEDDWRRGITSLRVGALGGHDGDRVTSFTYSNWPWDGGDKARYDLTRESRIRRRPAADPNAQSDGRGAAWDTERTPRFRVNLGSAGGSFLAEWFKPLDGETARARPVRAGGWLEFVSPWKGVDVVLHLWSEREEL